MGKVQNALFANCNSDADALSKLDFISNSAETIRNNYRNPAAHTTPMNKILADQCLDYIVDVTKILVKLMEMFR